MMTIVNREAPWFVWMEAWTATGERIKKSVSRRKWENPTTFFFRPFGFQFFAPPSTAHNRTVCKSVISSPHAVFEPRVLLDIVE